MQQQLTTSGIRDLLADLALSDVNSLIVLGAPVAAETDDGEPTISALEQMQSGDGIPGDLRADIAIVAGPFPGMTKAKAEHLLARLRDIHCRRVILILDDESWTADELRALGFLKKTAACVIGQVFLHDPDEFNEAREWNNPTHWANPERFGKYRW